MKTAHLKSKEIEIPLRLCSPLKRIIIGAPKKGRSIASPIRDLLGMAAIHYEENCSQTVSIKLDDLEVVVMMMAPQSIPRWVLEGDKDDNGTLRVGITGLDCVAEDQAKRSIYSKGEDNRVLKVGAMLPINKNTTGNSVKIVAARKSTCPAVAIQEKEERGEVRIVTEYLSLTKVKFPNIPYSSIEHAIGAAEEEFVSRDDFDLVVCVTETGRGLAEAGCEIYKVLMESQTVLVANRKSPQLDAMGRYLVYSVRKPGNYPKSTPYRKIMMHVPVAYKDFVKYSTPALREPNTYPIEDGKTISFDFVVKEECVLPLFLKVSHLISDWVEIRVDTVIP